jgi:hypothetical protein
MVKLAHGTRSNAGKKLWSVPCVCQVKSLTWESLWRSTGVLLFALAISVSSAVLIGALLPLRAFRPDMNETLNQDSSGTTGGRSNLAVRRILVGRDADGTGARVLVRRDAHNSETRW